MEALEGVCSRLGKNLFACMLRGPSAFTFVNLGPQFSFCEKDADGKKGPPRSFNYPPLSAAMSTPLASLTRQSHPLYPVVRLACMFEEKQGRPPGPSDASELQAMADGLAASEGTTAPAKAWHTPRADLVASWAASKGRSCRVN